MEILKKVKAASSKKEILIIAAVVLIVLVVSFAAFWLARGGGLEARIMEIFSVDGPDVSLTRGVEATVAASAGAKLHDGYGVFTGEDSICHIRLDADSLVRMDSLSRISVNRASATTLSILIEDGQILIDVQNQYPGHELEVLIGNSALGVRGTLFIAGYAGHVIMLEGSVYVDGEEAVSAGYVALLQDDEPLEVSPLRVGDLDRFAMQAVLDYSERVLEAGAITEEEFEWIMRRMDVPDYIWVQGIQISTDLTELVFTTDEKFVYGEFEHIYVVNLTNDDVELLVHMVNLLSLHFINQQFSDLIPLGELTNLRILRIENYVYDSGRTWARGARICDITPLANLINLNSLYILGSGLTDIIPLGNLTELRHLRLRNNDISCFSPLLNLTNLRTLRMDGENLNDITPLAELTELTWLMLNSNNISDISPLAGLVNLNFIQMIGNNISDISPIAGLTNLSNLGLAANNINDISPLVGLTRLRFLSLGGNNIYDITPLAELVNLTNLNLSSNLINDITPLAGLTELTSLQLDRNPITDWTPVAHVANVHGRP